MEPAAGPGVTTLLKRLDGDRAGAFAALIESVYADLRGIAGKRMHDRFGANLAGITLQPTALADDVVLELMNQRQEFQNSGQFFALAVRITMRLLTDYQRERLALKRGGGKRPEPLEGLSDPMAQQNREDLEADATLDALQDLHEMDPRKAEVVTLHILCGMPMPKVAQLIGVALPTVERDWRFSKTWLATRLKEANLG